MTLETQDLITQEELTRWEILKKRVIDSRDSLWWDLREIRTSGIFRCEHKTFREYVLSIGQDYSYVQRQISAMGVKASLLELPDDVPTVSKESQLRELAGVPAEELEKVLHSAATIDEKLPAKAIREAVSKVSSKKKPKKRAAKFKATPDPPPEPPVEPVAELNGEQAIIRSKLLKTLQACVRALDEYETTNPNPQKHAVMLNHLEQCQHLVWDTKYAFF